MSQRQLTFEIRSLGIPGHVIVSAYRSNGRGDREEQEPRSLFPHIVLLQLLEPWMNFQNCVHI